MNDLMELLLAQGWVLAFNRPSPDQPVELEAWLESAEEEEVELTDIGALGSAGIYVFAKTPAKAVEELARRLRLT